MADDKRCCCRNELVALLGACESTAAAYERRCEGKIFSPAWAGAKSAALAYENVAKRLREILDGTTCPCWQPKEDGDE